ncbi:signal peptidase I [Luteolibacter flavescens]|uniref:Signal peptidase I n=1 Tax=Luteolibacter flavescens TaxID=1859460 RepID=A0ABT3FJY7_9BACT|nr:signal peptidase I [Luteolibacter flavescens]MCW1883534.1 signal peptidase I [Luteolibacter flavescens]
MNIRKLAVPLCFLLFGIVVMTLVLTGTVKIFEIPTGSMTPTIQPGDHVTATRIFNPAGKVEKGDLVIFDAIKASARLSDSKYVQRVTAIEGDTVDLIDGRLHVNGRPLPDRDGKIPGGAHPFARDWPQPSYPHVVPAGRIFTLGDNHENALDSRYFGSFPVEAVTHRPGRIILPLSRAGKIE